MSEIKVVMTVGCLLRGEVRRYLQREGLRYYEDKGWLDSQFIVYGTREQIDVLQLIRHELKRA